MMAPFLQPEKFGISPLSRNCSPGPFRENHYDSRTVDALVNKELAVLERNVDVCRIGSNRRDLIPPARHHLRFVEYLDRHPLDRIVSSILTQGSFRAKQ